MPTPVLNITDFCEPCNECGARTPRSSIKGRSWDKCVCCRVFICNIEMMKVLKLRDNISNRPFY